MNLLMTHDWLDVKGALSAPGMDTASDGGTCTERNSIPLILVTSPLSAPQTSKRHCYLRRLCQCEQLTCILLIQLKYLGCAQVKEPNLEMLARGKIVYEKPRYMTINTVSMEDMFAAKSSSLQAALRLFDRLAPPCASSTLRGHAIRLCSCCRRYPLLMSSSRLCRSWLFSLSPSKPAVCLHAWGKLLKGAACARAPSLPSVVCWPQALEQLLEVEEKRKEGAYNETTTCIGVSRLQVRGVGGAGRRGEAQGRWWMRRKAR